MFSIDYRERIKFMSLADFIIYLPTDSYSFQASGALMDTVISKTPVIGIDTEFSSELRDKIGEFGFFFNSLSDLVKFVRETDVSLLFFKRNKFVHNLSKGVERIREIGIGELLAIRAEFVTR